MSKFNYSLRGLKLYEFNFRLIALLTLILNSSPVFAAAGDIINNTATIDFVYQGSSLIQESSPSGNSLPGIGNGTPTSFIEDRLINFSVVSSDASVVNVASSQPAAVLTFSVTNNGNAPQDFLLAAINTTPSPFVANPDNFDPVSPMQVFVENGSNAGYLLAEDTAVFIDDLAVGSSATVYIVATMPVTNIGDAAAVALVAQVAEGGVVGQGIAITNDDNGNISPGGTANIIPNTAGMETVFNDPAGINPEDVDSAGAQDIASNGQHSDVGVFFVQVAVATAVTLNKTVTVIDALGGTNPHAGSTLRYQIDVVVSGGSSVNNLVITDPIPINTTFTPSSLLLNGVVQTDANDTPTDYSEFNGSNIVVDLSQNGSVSVAPATPNLITFDVTID
ncbi:MAG: hypothetical protein OEY06_04420 [Gammaproteobacteria bacterium]|nr:hypothetical protein [Gammaproteobacteria bacterium]